MLLKIDLAEAHEIIHIGDKRIIIHISPDGSWPNFLHLATIRGETLEDFKVNPVERSKELSIGDRGGMSMQLDGTWYGDVSKERRVKVKRWEEKRNHTSFTF